MAGEHSGKAEVLHGSVALHKGRGSANQDRSPGQSSGMLGNGWCLAGWTRQGWERL